MNDENVTHWLAQLETITELIKVGNYMGATGILEELNKEVRSFVAGHPSS